MSSLSEALHTKHRPRKFADVIGQDAVIKSLSGMLERDQSQAFLLIGPSGTGKTTLARIAALKLGCKASDMQEVDAASHTGVDAMRQVAQNLHFTPMGGSDTRVVIVDEAHMLSKSAWNSLLKVLEEPPAHVYWFLCTTEPGKVPRTVMTRCASFTLKLVPEKSLKDLLSRVCEKEGIKLVDGVDDLVVKEADGSPRQLLVNLAAVVTATDKREAAELLKAALESDATRELCQFLLNGGSWLRAMGIVNKLAEENPESVRIVVMNYMASVLKGAKSDKEAIHVLSVMDAFCHPYNSSERLAPLLLSVGRVLLGS